MKNKRGFTLIELLAVILILAIIALIAVPVVNGIIRDSKKSAAESSTRNIIKSAESYYAFRLLKGELTGNIDVTKTKLDFSGTKPDKGIIEFDSKGHGSGTIYINGYCVKQKVDGSITSKFVPIDECNIESNEEPTTYPTFTTGSVAYFNPTTGNKCTSTEANSVLGQKSGCMRWYIFLDDETNSKVKLLLDHNTSDDVATSNINSRLTGDTSGWKETIDGKSTDLDARLITAEEINQIAPSDVDYVTWEDANPDSYYGLHEGNQYYYKFGYCKDNNFDWLIDHTGYYDSWMNGIDDCYSEIGAADNPICPEGEESCYSYGYWTSTTTQTTGYWGITSGMLTSEKSSWSISSVGIRPVIEVSKLVFE